MDNETFPAEELVGNLRLHTTWALHPTDEPGDAVIRPFSQRKTRAASHLEMHGYGHLAPTSECSLLSHAAARHIFFHRAQGLSDAATSNAYSPRFYRSLSQDTLPLTHPGNMSNGRGNGCKVQFSHSVVSDSLQPRESQHTRPLCPSPTPRVYSNSHPSSQRCHQAISSSVVPFSSCPQSFPASGSFQMSQLFA